MKTFKSCDMYAKIVVDTINRVYKNSLTTTSGGNLSVSDEEGNIYITPSSKDKGTLKAEDICRVAPDGTVTGAYKPSIELPFHSLIYKLRPDVKAVLHVHSPYLVAYSLLNGAPDVNILPKTAVLCKKAGLSLYDIPGSVELGRQIAKFIEKGFDSVMMQNHGVVLVAENMYEAYERLELLENAAKSCLYAKLLGGVRSLSEERIEKFYDRAMPEIRRAEPASEEEKELRKAICAFSSRCSEHGLFNCADGVISARTSDGFLITPDNFDRANLKPSAIVKIKDGVAYGGKPDICWEVHRSVYDRTETNAIMHAAPPCATAYGITGTELTSRTIPESYIMMRDTIKLPFFASFGDGGQIADAIKPANPVVTVENAFVFATGETLTKAFDRLEVSETTAKNLLLAKVLGTAISISDAEIVKIDEHFNLPRDERGEL